VTELLQMVLVFLKIGALIFGGGMSMLAFIQQDVVTTYGWLTDREFVDAVAMGQITPGPIVISSVFIGYKVAMNAGLPGVLGSVVALIAIILPSFLMTVVATHWLGKLSRNPKVRAVLRGLAPAVVGLILAAAFAIGRSSIIDVYTIAIALVALVLLIRFKVDTAIVILGAAVIGFFLL
jgi:chromate transporter